MAQIAQGRQDWQRTGEADSAQLVADPGTVNTGNRTIGPFNIAGFSALVGVVQALSGGWLAVEIDYWGEQARTTLMGVRNLAIDSASTNLAQLFTPSLGPWVSITFRPTGGATVWSARIFLSATTRYPSSLVLPTGALLANMQAVAIGAGATSIANVAELTAGPVTLAAPANLANVNYRVDVQTAPGVWSILAQYLGSATALITQNLTLPALPARLAVVNSGAGAVNAYATLTASSTGST